MFKNIINFIRYQRVIRQVYKSEQFIEKLSATLGVQLKRDWIDRLYTVVNPQIQNIQSNGNTLIFDGSREPQIEKWLMDNLNLVRSFIANNGLFDILTYDIKRLDDDDNYLITIKNILYNTIKKYVLTTLITIIIVLITLIIIL